MAAKRPGLQTAFQLPQEIRRALEPAFDLLMRLTAVTTPTIGKLNNFDDDALDPGTATTTDIATRVNDMQVELNGVIDKVNELISRLQED